VLDERYVSVAWASVCLVTGVVSDGVPILLSGLATCTLSGCSRCTCLPTVHLNTLAATPSHSPHPALPANHSMLPPHTRHSLRI